MSPLAKSEIRQEWHPNYTRLPGKNNTGVWRREIVGKGDWATKVVSSINIECCGGGMLFGGG